MEITAKLTEESEPSEAALLAEFFEDAPPSLEGWGFFALRAVKWVSSASVGIKNLITKNEAVLMKGIFGR